MKRRSFLGALGGIIAVWPRTGHGQRPALPMVGILGSGSPAPLFTTALADGLKESDYNEGRNVHLEYRWARGAYDMLPKLADELVSLRVNVLAAFGTPAAHAAKAASLKASPPIPVVFSFGSDPVAEGLVASLNRPGGNLTGSTSIIGSLIAEHGDKAVEIARRAARRARDQRNHALGRKYALVAAYITEQSKPTQPF